MNTIFLTRNLPGAVLSALVLGLVASCGGGGSDDTAGIPPSGIGDAVALGHGTDIFGTYASSDNIKAPVLDLVALNARGMLSIDPNVEEATFISTTGTSISEYASSLGVSVGVSGQYKFFTASIDTRFESEFYSREEFAFATVQELYKKSALKVGEQYRGPELMNFLTPEARQALATWTPDRILAAYGTHVMVGIYEGARLDYSMTMELSEEMISQGVSVYASVGFKMAFDSANIESGLDTDETQSVRESIKNTHVEAKGGQSQFAYCDETNDPAACDAARLTWLNSIDLNPVFCAIMYDGLIPIWEFAPTAERSAEIEAYYKAYGIGKHVEYPFPRYEDTGLAMIDHHTGLMWLKKLENADAVLDPDTRAHYDFWLEHIIPPVNNNLRPGGYSDWRMPSFDEVWSLVDHSKAPDALVDDRFGMIDSLYWSSTIDENDPTKLWVLLLRSERTSALAATVPRAYDAIGATMGAAILVREAY